MTTRDTRQNFLKLLDDTWPGVQSEFVAAMRQARAGVDMKALEAAIDTLRAAGWTVTVAGGY